MTAMYSPLQHSNEDWASTQLKQVSIIHTGGKSSLAD